ncbi:MULTISPECIES: cation transporter [unclassified Arthrobacter]|uniref:cation transporter n=1 Tax=unclassified Arthrobacter TaxID=235627 RepID=UPI0027D78FE4|nr:MULTISPECIES: cation transporter [unclassified Arthrobacter]
MAPEDSKTETVGAEYAVEGLTCGHCVVTVEKAVAAVDGVDAVSVELVRAANRAWSFPGLLLIRRSVKLSSPPVTARSRPN